MSTLRNGILFLVFCLGTCTPGTGEDIVYPPDCYYHNKKGGNVIDITRPPFNADPTGVKDCTASIIGAYDTLVRRTMQDKSSFNSRSIIIYLPKGTYRVSNTIVYTGDPLVRPNGQEALVSLKFRGQCMDSTIIKLVDNAPGFTAGANKPVISYGKLEYNNAVASNFFENLTINTGSGNPGAVGLLFHGANNEAVRNVKIISGDGTGAIGLDLPIGACQGYYKHISVEGFNIGVHVSKTLAKSVSFEHLTLKGQHRAGMLIEESAVSVRKLKSQNSVPAVQMIREDGHLVILDSELSGGAEGIPGIRLDRGILYARNISTSGYSMAIGWGLVSLVPGPVVDEFVSDRVYSLFEQESEGSLQLNIEETPDIPWESNPGSWASVKDYGALGNGTTDDTEAIRRAMDSGFPIIYFHPGKYLINGSIGIPETVEVVNFMFSGIIAGPSIRNAGAKGLFRISENGETPLLIEDMFTWMETEGHCVIIDHACTRTLLMQDLHAQRGKMYRNSVGGGKVFIENCSVRTTKESSYNHIGFEFNNQQAWIRYINSEKGIPAMKFNGGKAWVMGFKTEGSGASFEVVNGGMLEVCGGISNAWGQRAEYGIVPQVINRESSVSCTFVTGGPDITFPTPEYDRYYEVLVREIRGGDTRDLSRHQLPVRYGKHVVVPLYAGNNLPLGIPHNPESLSLSVFPNPVQDHVIVHVLTERESSLRIRLFDITGRELPGSEQSARVFPGENRIKLNMKPFQPGSYIIHLEGGGTFENISLVHQ